MKILNKGIYKNLEGNLPLPIGAIVVSALKFMAVFLHLSAKFSL
jgi:hypothetical protein